MSEIVSAAADLGSEPSLTILVVGGLMIFALSAIWSALERYWDRLAQRPDL